MSMTRGDVVRFSKELMQKLQQYDVKLDDWKYMDMLDDYREMVAKGVKRSAVAIILAERYKMSERQVYNVLRRMKEPV